MTYTWIIKSDKLTKTLVVELFWFISIITFVSVMTTKINTPTIVVMSNRVRLFHEVMSAQRLTLVKRSKERINQSDH